MKNEIAQHLGSNRRRFDRPACPAGSARDGRDRQRRGAQRIFDQAAAVIHAEAIVAKHKGDPLRFGDSLGLNGKHSSYALFVGDPAKIAGKKSTSIPIINVTASAEDAMLTRALLAGVPRGIAGG